MFLRQLSLECVDSSRLCSKYTTWIEYPTLQDSIQNMKMHPPSAFRLLYSSQEIARREVSWPVQGSHAVNAVLLVKKDEQIILSWRLRSMCNGLLPPPPPPPATTTTTTTTSKQLLMHRSPSMLLAFPETNTGDPCAVLANPTTEICTNKGCPGLYFLRVWGGEGLNNKVWITSLQFKSLCLLLLLIRTTITTNFY